ncbi:MAG: DUF1552 domain-containing protein [Deltaproteobacteria bacterium]|nr:DUF1552 domain-containing protein [Deltaproteobacteria bacterium]
MTNTFSRRTVLQTLATIPFAAPLARALAAPDAPAPKRLMLFMQNNGTQQGNFWPKPPTETGNPNPPPSPSPNPSPSPLLRSPILNSLFTRADGSDNGLAAKTNLIKGVTVPFDVNGTNGNEHDMGFARMFTGERLLSRAGQPWGGGPSVDQILANDWGADSLTLAALASQYEPHPKPGFNHRRSFCYVGPATLKYPLVDPLRVYRKLFATNDGVDARRRLLLRKSVLDAVRGNLSEVATRLGPDDAHKLDYHLTAIRDVERRLSNTLSSTRTACPVTPVRPRDFLALNPGAETNTEAYLPELIDSLIDLAALALTCGLTRIATMQFGFAGGKWGFWWKGINIELHENIAHRDDSDAGSSPENTASLVLANQYYASRVARLATALNDAPEGSGGGSVLDNTLVVWANELGRGNHSQTNVPTVLLGLVGNSSGKGIARGGRVIDQGEQVFNRLGCTILNLMDKPVAGFGDQPTCGSFVGL